MRLSSRLVLTAAMLAVAANAGAQPGSGDRYSVTSRIEMPGMPFQMPPQKTEVCTSKQAATASMVPKEDNCRVYDFKIVGQKSSYRIECTGKDAMTGEGENEQLGATAYRGSMRMKGKAEGEDVNIVMRYDGKRVGDCDFGKESPQAIGAAMNKQACDMQVDIPGAYKSFIGPDAPCASQRAAYCANVVKHADTMSTPKGFPEHEMGMVWEGFEACGRPRATILAKACSSAQSGGNLAFIGTHCPSMVAQACAGADARRQGGFVAAHCPDQAKALAAQQCQGRGYTAMNASPYRDFCNRYAGQRLQERNAGAANPNATPDEAAQPAPEAAPAKPTMRDRLKGLKDKLGGG